MTKCWWTHRNLSDITLLIGVAGGKFRLGRFGERYDIMFVQFIHLVKSIILRYQSRNIYDMLMLGRNEMEK